MKVAEGLPPQQRGRVDWAEVVAFLRKHPGETVLMDQFRQVDRARYLYTTVKQKASPWLRLTDATVVPNIRNGARGGGRGDLYLTLVPNDQDRKEDG